MASAEAHVDVGGRSVRISSPDKVYFPDAGITKLQLAEYYGGLAEPLMRALRDRPVALNRFPDGLDGGKSFFTKAAPKGMPEWAETAAVTFPSGRRGDEVCVTEAATVVWTVQMGTLELHPWPVRRADADHPDELRIDLDPQPGTGFAEAVAVAQEARALCDELGIRPFVKTSGGRGLHLLIRIEPRWTFVEARRAVIAFARELERRRPELVTTSWWKEERGERIFVDFNQMARDRMTVAAYSTRARPEATVSMPLDWSRLPDVEPSDFTPHTVPDLVARYGDALAEIDGAAFALDVLLEMSERDEKDRGLGDLPYPPEFPKMPGEPKRVQPSKARHEDGDGPADAARGDGKGEGKGDEKKEGGEMKLPILPPVEPMLAKSVAKVPVGDYLYEPKWDGFRCLVFRDGDELDLASRGGKSLTRYFPELVASLREALPLRCVLDGEIVVVSGGRLEFDRLSDRIHPAASRVELLAHETPASYVAFDILALGDDDLAALPFEERRAVLEGLLGGHSYEHVHVTRATADPEVAQGWFERFEGAGLDGVIAKPLQGPYTPGERTMAKIKHERTADAVLAGYRLHKSGPVVGSLMLGLHGPDSVLNFVGAVSAFTNARRAELVEELAPLVVAEGEPHPWTAEVAEDDAHRRPGALNRWNAGKDMSFIALRPERVVEVRYDQLQGDRFRHNARFVRWRPDREPASCTYDQLDVPEAYDLKDVFG